MLYFLVQKLIIFFSFFELYFQNKYRQRPTNSLNMAVLPASIARSEKNAEVEVSGLDRTVALASRAINQGDT